MSRRLLTVTLVVGLMASMACGRADDTARMKELQRLRSGALDVVLLSSGEAFRHGRDSFAIEFHSTSGGNLVDVGAVRVSATMPMPGMPMFASVDVQPTSVKGRYVATSNFDMAGTWRVTIEWDGPAGRGSVSFSGSVQ